MLVKAQSLYTENVKAIEFTYMKTAVGRNVFLQMQRKINERGLTSINKCSNSCYLIVKKTDKKNLQIALKSSSSSSFVVLLLMPLLLLC